MCQSVVSVELNEPSDAGAHLRPQGSHGATVMGVPTDYHSPYPSPAREILSMHEATRLVFIRICYSDTSALRGGGCKT